MSGMSTRSDKPVTVVPFQGTPQQPYNASRAEHPCCVCGRNVPSPKWYARVVIDNGTTRWAMPDEIIVESRGTTDLGGFRVGSAACAKRLGRFAIPAGEGDGDEDR